MKTGITANRSRDKPSLENHQSCYTTISKKTKSKNAPLVIGAQLKPRMILSTQLQQWACGCSLLESTVIILTTRASTWVAPFRTNKPRGRGSSTMVRRYPRRVLRYGRGEKTTIWKHATAVLSVHLHFSEVFCYTGYEALHITQTPGILGQIARFARTPWPRAETIIVMKAYDVG